MTSKYGLREFLIQGRFALKASRTQRRYMRWYDLCTVRAFDHQQAKDKADSLGLLHRVEGLTPHKLGYTRLRAKLIK